MDFIKLRGNPIFILLDNENLKINVLQVSANFDISILKENILKWYNEWLHSATIILTYDIWQWYKCFACSVLEYSWNNLQLIWEKISKTKYKVHTFMSASQFVRLTQRLKTFSCGVSFSPSPPFSSDIGYNKSKHFPPIGQIKCVYNSIRPR